jgi:penicillin-binding protein 1C
MTGVRRIAVRFAAVAAGAALLLAAATGGAMLALGPPPLDRDPDLSSVVVDREGRVLRPYTNTEGRWRLEADLARLDPRLIDLLVAYEDKRFRWHPGVDPFAMARAVWQFLTHGRVISGGSTITMQVARLLEPRPERTVANKLREMVRALQIESRLTKDEILALYFTLAPYGGNLEGARAAALTYFGKDARRLTLGEVALLVALPQSPELRRPDRAPDAARAARKLVLERLAAAGAVPREQLMPALAEPLPTGRLAMPMLAPHLADRLTMQDPATRRIETTLDAPVQAVLEGLARERAPAFGAEASIAIVVVEHATGRIVARVASADFMDEARRGQVDMTLAVRSPGSTLKPFIYALGFEDGLIHPDTLIEDRPVRFGAWAPENFDLTFQGTVTVRKALQLSLNVPVVQVLDAVGPARLGTRLAAAGGRLVLPPGEAPGLAMGLGGVGVRLIDLVAWYAGIARGGDVVIPFERPGAPAETLRLVDPVAAWYTASALIGTPPPVNAVPGRVAFKTGTSYGYRDAWSVGFDGRHTIGVWVGRPDGAPMPGLIGRQAAAPILFDAFQRLNRPIQPLPAPPKGAVVATTARLPMALQRFRAPGLLPALPGETAPVRIMFPPDGAQVAVTGSPGVFDPVAVKVTGGVAPFTLYANGRPLTGDPRRRVVDYAPDGPGFVRLTVVDGRGQADSVTVRLQ